MEVEHEAVHRSRGLVLGFVLIAGALSIVPSAHAAGTGSVLRSLDPDHDGSVDLAAAKAAASKLFDGLDRDHDGTLDRRELRGRLKPVDFAAADPDHDGTLDKNEYLGLVEKRFNAANNDSTIDDKDSTREQAEACCA